MKSNGGSHTSEYSVETSVDFRRCSYFFQKSAFASRVRVASWQNWTANNTSWDVSEHAISLEGLGALVGSALGNQLLPTK